MIVTEKFQPMRSGDVPRGAVFSTTVRPLESGVFRLCIRAHQEGLPIDVDIETGESLSVTPDEVMHVYVGGFMFAREYDDPCVGV